MRAILLASAAMAVLPVAFDFGETVETVSIKGADGKPVRVNKSDFDADQADDGEKAMTLHDDSGDTEQSALANGAVTLGEGVKQLPAPSAVDNGNLMRDGVPAAPSQGQIAVAKKGNKVIAVYPDGTPVTDLRIDPKGYDSEDAAWIAIKAVEANPTPLGTPPVGGDGTTPLAGEVK